MRTLRPPAARPRLVTRAAPLRRDAEGKTGEDEGGGGADKALPVARVKRMMRLDPEVNYVQGDAARLARSLPPPPPPQRALRARRAPEGAGAAERWCGPSACGCILRAR